MLAINSIEHIDQQLNELEELAKSDIATARFFNVFTERLRFVLGAHGCTVFLPAPNDSALPLAHAGSVSESTIKDLLTQLKKAENLLPKVLSGISDQQHWFAIALRKTNFQKGCLLVTFLQKPTQDAVHALSEVITAFAEVAAIKQLSDIEGFLDSRWQAMQSLCTQITESQHIHDAAMCLVNHLLAIVGASRVSLAGVPLIGGPQVIAVSGVPGIDHRSPITHALRQVAQQVIRTNQPVMHKQSAGQTAIAPGTALPEGQEPVQLNDDGLFSNLLAVKLAPQADQSSDSVLIIEWQSTASMVGALPILSHVLPLLATAWKQHERWLRIPRGFRSLFGRQYSLGMAGSRTIKVAVLLALLLGTYVALTTKYPLKIEAPATLEPAVQHAVFASVDGFVNEILVEDGQAVQAGELVAKLRSPSLELQMEELRGQQRTLSERRSGLRVASGQVDPAARDAMITQSRLSAEIAQLTAQDANIDKQLKLLQEEYARLELTAPISGIVVARDIKQQLSGRPVRRGDALLTVVDLKGPWRLRIEVADRDSGYVQEKLAQSTDVRSEQRAIDFVLDALPEKRFMGHVQWIASTVQNRIGEGCYLELHAQVDRDVVEQSQMGAGARTWFECGRQPLWFVWCRPLVEAAQRKLWFWNEEVNDVGHSK